VRTFTYACRGDVLQAALKEQREKAGAMEAEVEAARAQLQQLSQV